MALLKQLAPNPQLTCCRQGPVWLWIWSVVLACSLQVWYTFSVGKNKNGALKTQSKAVQDMSLWSMNARKIHIWARIDLVTPGSLCSHRRKKCYIQSIISGLGFLRPSVEYIDGWLLTRKPQVMWRAQVWVYSFGQMKLMSRSWSQSQVLGLFAITFHCAKITAHVILHCLS